jgi:hypothetical protein
MIPVQLNFGITEHLNISRYETPITVPLKKYAPMTRLAVTPANIITFHNVSRHAAAVNCTFI